MRLGRLSSIRDREEQWRETVALANARLDIGSTARLARTASALFASDQPPGVVAEVRLAVLSSSTTTHLLASLVVGAMRRGFWLRIFVTEYNQYYQALQDAGSDLYQFAPTDVLLAFDASHMTMGLDLMADERAALAVRRERLEHVKGVWRLCRERLACSIIQQTILPVFEPILGSNEHRLPGSRADFVSNLNAELRRAADDEGVDVLSVDERCSRHGARAWYEPTMWFMAKQEVAPSAAALYGDLVGRLIAARRGRSFKALVLDLDNTLWGGVVGDDGVDGIVGGQGPARGVSFVAFQQYVKMLGRRGIILAVCSKNDRVNAVAPFETRRDMILRMDDFSAFEANWDDKALNLRRIASQLNIGLDAVVFVDDNPFERELVRGELPMVAVPEVPEEPVLIASCIADAGYFESTGLSREDRQRATLYADNAERAAFAEHASDLDGYLRGLDMQLLCRSFDRDGLSRIVQLINKTNQFNLTTHRYSDNEILERVATPAYVTLQLRLVDRFGDNGMIAVVIGERVGDQVHIDTWLMSCRVLGRRVEQATLDIIVRSVRPLGVRKLIGRYKPTAKNGMVRDHYEKLGFAFEGSEGDATTWSLDIDQFQAAESVIRIVDQQTV